MVAQVYTQDNQTLTVRGRASSDTFGAIQIDSAVMREFVNDGFKIDFTATSQQSAAAPDGVTGFRLIADQDCWFLIGANPTAVAVTSRLMLAAASPEYFAINPGQKIAVLRKSADGTAHISWVK